MAVFTVFSPQYSSFSTATTVTIAGRTIAPHGAVLSRRVAAYNDNNTLFPLSITQSDPADGTFSMSVNGYAETLYTVICKGENGEQDVVYSLVKE